MSFWRIIWKSNVSGPHSLLSLFYSLNKLFVIETVSPCLFVAKIVKLSLLLCLSQTCLKAKSKISTSLLINLVLILMYGLPQLFSAIRLALTVLGLSLTIMEWLRWSRADYTRSSCYLALIILNKKRFFILFGSSDRSTYFVSLTGSSTNG